MPLLNNLVIPPFLYFATPIVIYEVNQEFANRKFGKLESKVIE